MRRRRLFNRPITRTSMGVDNETQVISTHIFCFVFVNPKMMSKKLDTNQPNHMAKKLDKLKKIGFNAVWKVFVLCFRHSIESLHIYSSASYFYLTSHKQ